MHQLVYCNAMYRMIIILMDNRNPYVSLKSTLIVRGVDNKIF